MASNVWRVTLVAGCLAVAVVSSAAAQGLADLARRTEEARRDQPGPARRYEVLAEPNVHLTPLNREVVGLYVGLRIDMARLWTRDRGLFQRLQTGAHNARTFEDSCRVLETEPEIMALLKRYEHTPYSFFSLMLSLQQATRRATEGVVGYEEVTAVQRANHDYVGRDLGWLSANRSRILRAEAGWSIWE